MVQNSSPDETKGPDSPTSLESIVIQELPSTSVKQRGYEQGYCASMGHYVLFYFYLKHEGRVNARLVKVILATKEMYFIDFYDGSIQVTSSETPESAKLQKLIEFKWNDKDTTFIEQLAIQKGSQYSSAVFEAIQLYRARVKPLQSG